MAKVTVCVSSIGLEGAVPLMPADAQEIVDAFEVASGGEIELEIEQRTLRGQGALPSVTAFDLHAVSAQLTGNTNMLGRVKRISLLFATCYEPRADLYGVMFDRGFATYEEPDSNAGQRAVPREGCAVFVGEIARAKADPTEASRQALFTAIHELGHVFNLQHRDGAQFMAGSFGGPKAPKQKLWKFNKEQGNWLAGADSNPMVWPGGAAFLDRSEERSADRPRLPGVQLAIAMARQEFTYNSPVELDITLSVASGAASIIEVRNEIDPGYPGFQLWIEDPEGERRRYRPINRYCAPACNFALTAARPFERDLSVYAQSGGFTFNKPGAHRLWARLADGSDGWIVSNTVEFELVTPGREARIDSEFLRSRKAQALLFYRRLRDVRDVKALDALAGELADMRLRASVSYALARALERQLAKKPSRGALREMMMRHANLASERPQALGKRQAHHLSRILQGR